MALGTCPNCDRLVTPSEIRTACCPHCAGAIDENCRPNPRLAEREAVLHNLPRNHGLALPTRRLSV